MEGTEAVVQQNFIQLVVDTPDMLPDRGAGVGLRAELTETLLIQRLVSLLDIREEMFQHQVDLQHGEVLLLLPAHLASLLLRLRPPSSSWSFN